MWVLLLTFPWMPWRWELMCPAADTVVMQCAIRTEHMHKSGALDDAEEDCLPLPLLPSTRERNGIWEGDLILVDGNRGCNCMLAWSAVVDADADADDENLICCNLHEWYWYSSQVLGCSGIVWLLSSLSPQSADEWIWGSWLRYVEGVLLLCLVSICFLVRWWRTCTLNYSIMYDIPTGILILDTVGVYVVSLCFVSWIHPSTKCWYNYFLLMVTRYLSIDIRARKTRKCWLRFAYACKENTKHSQIMIDSQTDRCIEDTWRRNGAAAPTVLTEKRDKAVRKKKRVLDF